MANAIALAASRFDLTDHARQCIVCACALALILAGQPLPL
jgi:hypothetical protein